MNSIEIRNESMTLSRRNVLFGIFSLALVLFAWDPIRRLIALSLNLENGHLSYIPLIPFVSVTLIYWNRSEIFGNLRSSPLFAGVALGAGSILYYVGRTYGLHLVENDRIGVMTSAVIALWFGGFLLIYGASAFKAAFFPLMFLLLAIPMPLRILDGSVSLLQRGSADMVSALFTATRTTFFRPSPMIFDLPSVSIEVAPACSGIRSTIGLVIVTILAAHFFLTSGWRKVILLAAVVFISLLKNAVRIVTLTLLAVHWDMGFLTGNLHHEGGFVFMALGLVLMYPVLLLLMKSEGKTFEDGVRS